MKSGDAVLRQSVRAVLGDAGGRARVADDIRARLERVQDEAYTRGYAEGMDAGTGGALVGFLASAVSGAVVGALLVLIFA